MILILPDSGNLLSSQSVQSWALAVFFNLFNYKNDIFCIFIKLIWLGVRLFKWNGREIGYRVFVLKKWVLFFKNKKYSKCPALRQSLHDSDQFYKYWPTDTLTHIDTHTHTEYFGLSHHQLISRNRNWRIEEWIEEWIEEFELVNHGINISISSLTINKE